MPIAVIVRFMPRFFLRLPPESMEPRRCPEPPPTSEVVRDMAFGISPPTRVGPRRNGPPPSSLAAEQCAVANPPAQPVLRAVPG